VSTNTLELTRREILALFGVAAAIKSFPVFATPLTHPGESGPAHAGASQALRLADVDADLEQMLNLGTLPSPQFPAMSIRFETTMVAMRDGVRLATDLYLPPELPAPAVVIRTPYSRDRDSHVSAFMSYARRGYVVVSQD